MVQLIDFTDPNEPRHDVTLVIGREKIYVGKQILAFHSPVFDRMFFGDFNERTKKEIELKGVGRKEFIEMLNLIYPTYQKITEDNSESLLKLAERFQIKIVVDQVEQFLINSTEFLDSKKLVFADQYRLVKLHDHCLRLFDTLASLINLKLHSTEDYEKLSDKAQLALLNNLLNVTPK